MLTSLKEPPPTPTPPLMTVPEEEEPELDAEPVVSPEQVSWRAFSAGTPIHIYPIPACVYKPYRIVDFSFQRSISLFRLYFRRRVQPLLCKLWWANSVISQCQTFWKERHYAKMKVKLRQTVQHSMMFFVFSTSACQPLHNMSVWRLFIVSIFGPIF